MNSLQRRLGLGLIAALLIALAAAGMGGWSFWQGQQLQRQAQAQLAEQRQLQQEWQTARTESEQQLAATESDVRQRLEQLPSQEQLAEQRQLLQTLQGDQQHLAQSLTRLLGASREDWRLAEAEHLLRLAILRLSALQDVPSAIALVQVADDILRAQDDPLGFAARGEMIKALEALRALPQPDRSGLFLQLAALREGREIPASHDETIRFSPTARMADLTLEDDTEIRRPRRWFAIRSSSMSQQGSSNRPLGKNLSRATRDCWSALSTARRRLSSAAAGAVAGVAGAGTAGVASRRDFTASIKARPWR